jgi:toxin FitB
VERIVLDTDVASLMFKDALPPELTRMLVGRQLVLTWVTVGEMTRWPDERNGGDDR